MKTGNIGLWITGAFIAWFGWIMLDMSAPDSASAAGSSIADVRSSSVPVLVEFYADWCGPCKVVGPVVEELAREVKGRAKVIRINVDKEPELAAENRISGIPTFIAYKGGKEVGRQSGAIPKAMMKDMLGL